MDHRRRLFVGEFGGAQFLCGAPLIIAAVILAHDITPLLRKHLKYGDLIWQSRSVANLD
jgi:hypothetical protein